MLSLDFMIFTIIEIIFYLFHFSMFILLIAKRNTVFKGPFYNIFRVVIFSELMCYIILMLFQKIPLIPSLISFYESNGNLAYILINTFMYFTVAEFLGHTLMAFNRFTLIWFPILHKNIWNKHWYTIVILTLPILHYIWKINQPAKFVYFSDETVNLMLPDQNIWSLHLLISTIIFMVTTSMAAIFNILSFAKLYCYHHSTNFLLTVNERNLLFVSFITFLAQLLRISNNVIRLFFLSNENVISFFNTLLPMLYGVFAWSGSVSLMVLSQTVRKEYISFYFCKKPKVSVVYSFQRHAQINTALSAL